MAIDAAQMAEFVLKHRDLIASGAFGDPATVPAAREKLAEYEARVEFARQQGHLPPAPEPWSPARVAAEQLAAEHPWGEQSLNLPEHLGASVLGRLEQLAMLSPVEIAAAERDTAADLDRRVTEGSLAYGWHSPELGRRPSGSEQSAKMAKDAARALERLAPEKARDYARLLRADRRSLELLAASGRTFAAYEARKKEFGLS